MGQCRSQFRHITTLNFILLSQFQSCSPSHYRDERSWRVEFSTESHNILNALEQIGYKVITSSSFVTGHKKFDTKVSIITIYSMGCKL